MTAQVIPFKPRQRVETPKPIDPMSAPAMIVQSASIYGQAAIIVGAFFVVSFWFLFVSPR